MVIILGEILFLHKNVVGTHKIDLVEALLMSTHKYVFMEN